MEIYVEPAKRPGKRKLIRKSTLEPTEIDQEHGGIRLSIEAAGIYDDSRYRYTIKLSRENLELIYEAWNGARAHSA
ncbi:hypothetical protein ACVCNR_15020 [Aquamicrobium terrae]